MDIGEDRSLYCRLEEVVAIPEFGDGTECMRFIGVQKKDFNELAFSQDNEGANTFVIDVARAISTGLYPSATRPFDGRDFLRGLCPRHDDCNICREGFYQWFQVELQPDSEGQSYAYSTFGLANPTRLTVATINLIDGPPLSPFPEYSYRGVKSSQEFSLSAFEVGQGMSSLVFNDHEAFLIDAGAGTPIRSQDYVKKKGWRNDLITLVENRTVRFFLSHSDADHWRMLAWDDRLINQISEFVVPSGMRSVAFFDVKVKKRVRELSNHLRIDLGAGSRLHIFRSQPERKTSNNDGLIVVFDKDRELALLPGDCTYSDMQDDCDLVVRTLPSLEYSAVVVPHHGDERSSQAVPLASNNALAFFSAGDHASFDHPRKISVAAHKERGFKNLVKKKPKGIIEKKLL